MTARSRLAASPTTGHGSSETSKRMPCARRRTRVTARSTTSARSTSPTTWLIGSSRASSTRSPTRALSSSIWPRTSSSSSSRACGGSAVLPSAWRSRSRLVRREVSGVRSSWLASATSRRWRSREAPRASSISLKAVASRAISSSPSTRSGVRSSVTVMRSTEEREAAHRPEPVAGDEPADQQGGEHAERAEDEEHPAELLERAVVGGERLGEDQGLSAAGRHGRRPGSAHPPSVTSVRTTDSRWPVTTSYSGSPSLKCGMSVPARGAVSGDEDDADVGRAEHPGRPPADRRGPRGPRPRWPCARG